MRSPPEQSAIEEAIRMLAGFLQMPEGEVRSEVRSDRHIADAIVEAGALCFALEWKSAGSAALVSDAIQQVRRVAAEADGSLVPLVVVPYMGDVGRRLCEEAGVAWMDLSGNAMILAPGLQILIDGRKNRFKRRGRPSSAFAPKSSRIARWLLMHPTQALHQRHIAQETGMDEGFTSRIVAKLVDDGLVVRNSNGAIRPRDPKLLLDAWSEDYEFSKHRILRGHVAARSEDELLQHLAGLLREREVDHAATGLAAAWRLTRFAGFRLVTLYLAQEPSSSLLEGMAFRDDPRGANVWLVVPNDEGVFLGASTQRDVRCVHPVQVYLDLKHQPERAQEAAEHLRAELFHRVVDG